MVECNGIMRNASQQIFTGAGNGFVQTVPNYSVCIATRQKASKRHYST